MLKGRAKRPRRVWMTSSSGSVGPSGVQDSATACCKPPTNETVLAETRPQLERAVIGPNLCPIAKGQN